MKAEMPGIKNYTVIRKMLQLQGLHTVCESAGCPNKGECWNRGTATFMILGDKCTRNCRFCQVETKVPDAPDAEEPEKLARTVKSLDIRHVVITSVTRDDLPDGGAAHWAQTIRMVKKMNPGVTMEVLIPDFRKDFRALDTIIETGPDVISHNLETVRRLTPAIRSVANYDDSLAVIRYIHRSGFTAKTGIMAGLGEKLS